MRYFYHLLLGAVFICACRPLPTQEPVDNQQLVLTAPTPVPVPSQLSIEPVAQMMLHKSELPLSAYYPIRVRLYRDLNIERAAPLSEAIFLTQASPVAIDPGDLKTQDPYTLVIQGQQFDGRCRFEATYRLNTDAAAKAPFFKRARQTQIELKNEDLVLTDKSLDCHRSFDQIGRVTDALGNALSEVEIQIALKQRDGGVAYQSELRTDAKGEFTVPEAPTGVFLTLKASKAGYQPRTLTFSAHLESDGRIDQLERLDVVLQPQA